MDPGAYSLLSEIALHTNVSLYAELERTAVFAVISLYLFVISHSAIAGKPHYTAQQEHHGQIPKMLLHSQLFDLYAVSCRAIPGSGRTLQNASCRMRTASASGWAWALVRWSCRWRQRCWQIFGVCLMCPCPPDMYLPTSKIQGSGTR